MAAPTLVCESMSRDTSESGAQSRAPWRSLADVVCAVTPDLVATPEYGESVSAPPDATATNVVAAATQAPLINFNGISDDGTVIPPDVAGAPGPTALSPHLNNLYGSQLRDGAFMGTTQNPNTYWTGGPGIGAFDPRSVYDPYGDRWLFTAADNGGSAASQVLIAASKSIEPTPRYQFAVTADSTGATWADFPAVGFTSTLVVVTANMFSMSTNAFVQSRFYVFDKAALYAGTLSVQIIDGGGANGGGFCPTFTYDPAQPIAYLVQRFNPNSGGTGSLRIASISGTVGSLTLTFGALVTAPAWSSAGPIVNGGFAPQAGTAVRITTNDDRVLTVAYRQGLLWCAQTVFYPAGGSPTRASVQWWSFTPAGVLSQRGLLDDPTNTLFYAFPSLAVNRNLDVLVGCSRFTATQFASAVYAYHDHSDAAGALRTEALLVAGLGPYTKDFGTGVVRWGDYTSTFPDPSDDAAFWTYQEYAGASNTWATRWGRVPCLSRAHSTGTTPSAFFGPASSPGVYRPGGAVSTWFLSTTATGGAANALAVQLGAAGDVQIPSRCYSASRSSVAVWRTSALAYLLLPPDNDTVGSLATVPVAGATASAYPICGDVNGDGADELGIVQGSNSTWTFVDIQGTVRLSAAWGLSTDVPMTGDWMNVGAVQLGVWRPLQGRWFLLNPVTGVSTTYAFGQPYPGSTDVPIVGDFLGTGYAQLCIWRASNGVWFIFDQNTGASKNVQWGQLGDVPLEGDFDGDGVSDIAVWRPSEGRFYIIRSSTGVSYTVQLGVSTDIPTTACYTYRRMQQLGVPI